MKLWNSHDLMLFLVIEMSHLRECLVDEVTRGPDRCGYVGADIEDLLGHLSLDRISPCVIPSAGQECKPLIGKSSLRHVTVPDIGLLSGARENRAMAEVADEAETESWWGNEDGRGHR